MNQWILAWTSSGYQNFLRLLRRRRHPDCLHTVTTPGNHTVCPAFTTAPGNRADVDINTSDTSTPTNNQIYDPITRAHGQKLNNQVFYIVHLI
jgi:hypothetical protein